MKTDNNRYLILFVLSISIMVMMPGPVFSQAEEELSDTALDDSSAEATEAVSEDNGSRLKYETADVDKERTVSGKSRDEQGENEGVSNSGTGIRERQGVKQNVSGSDSSDYGTVEREKGDIVYTTESGGVFKTAYGDVKIRLLGDGTGLERLDIEIGKGDALIIVPKDYKANINLETENGSIKIPSGSERESLNNADNTYAQIRVRVDRGNIVVQEKGKKSFSIGKHYNVAATGDSMVVSKNNNNDKYAMSGEEKKRKARSRGYGGGLSVISGLMYMDMGPVHELVVRDKRLKDVSFGIDWGYEIFPVTGLIGYGGIGNEVRIGGGGYKGKKLISAYSGGVTDTLHRIELDFNAGGFLLEKNKAVKNSNFFIGGIIGAGIIELNVKELNSEGVIKDEHGKKRERSFKSMFGLLEIHGGVTYSFASWIHAGFDLAFPLIYSPQGFEWETGEFQTANSIIRIRLVFGNLG